MKTENVKSWAVVLDQNDKLIKYAQIVVKRHGKPGFEDNVKALKNYLIEELKIKL